jgi:ATP-dependent Zn protease
VLEEVKAVNKQWLRPDVLFAIVVIPLSIACSPQQALTPKDLEPPIDFPSEEDLAEERLLRYDQFVEQVENGKVTRVIFNSDRTQAKVQTKNGKYRVNLPNDPGLIDILTKAKGVDIVVEPSGDKDVTRSRSLRYDEFIKKVETGEVTKVTLNPDRTHARVKTNSGEYRVNLPKDPNLLDLLTTKDIDIAIDSSINNN